MILYSTPYRTDKNIGRYYNDFMSRLKPGEWGCFTDGDAMFTTPYFGTIMEEYIRKYPDVSLFTAKTNRVLNTPQLYKGRISDNFDMKFHFAIGQSLAHKRDITYIGKETPVSGVLMLMSKAAWDECKFQEGTLGVDNEIHYYLLRKSHKVAVMEGLYMLHWYRGNNYRDTSHLQ